MESSEVSIGSETLNDVMYRRLKNRERQRRYRERKRLQADASNGHVTHHSSRMQNVSLPTNGTVEQVITRVHCRRDWKKDARRIHVAVPEAIWNGLLPSGQCLASDFQIPHVPAGMSEAEQTGEVFLESNINKIRSKPGRRDWKAEARNKK